MQFIPGTWHTGGYSGAHGDGRDGNGDGIADPNNVYDSALAAAVHLAGNRHVNLTDPAHLDAAIYRYNHATWYVRNVRHWIDHYDKYARQHAPADAAPYVGGSGRGAIAVRAALKWLGTPYSWGGGTTHGPSYGFAQGAGIKGFDCASLVQYAWAQAGVHIPRVTYDQWDAIRHVPANQRQPGDLVFFVGGLGSPGNPGHVGMMIDRNRMVEAPHTGSHVRIRPINNRSDRVGFARPG
jgi:cell wall-associated NlpC family hydrolase